MDAGLREMCSHIGISIEDADPSQEVLSVLVRHTYNADPENLEVNLENQLTDRLHHSSTHHINGQYACPSCGRLFVNKTRYMQHVKYPCKGKYKCSSCGKHYSLKTCYERHLKFLCAVAKKSEPKNTEKDVLLLPRLRIRKPANLKQEDGHVEPAPAPATVLVGVKDDTSDDESSDSHSSNTETEASDSWDADDKVGDDDKSCMEAKGTARQPSLEKDRDGEYFSSILGRHLDTLPEPGVASAGPCLVGVDPVLRVQQWVVDSVPTGGRMKLLCWAFGSASRKGPYQLVYCCSVPYCGQSFMEEQALLDHQGKHLDCGPKNGVNQKRRRVDNVRGDQAKRGTIISKTSAESHVPHTDYLSMIQISNVMSLVTSRDEVLPMTEEAVTSAGKGREPEGGELSAGKDAADKLSWRSWVQRCIRNRMCATQKRLISRRRLAVCLLCGRRFSRNPALDQHMASAHCEKFRYRCRSCNMSFKARTYLCRHVLQAHCDLKKLKCCVCKRRYRAVHLLQHHVLKLHSGRHQQP